ncbi:hypothetical protein ABRY74_12195 [Pseudomonas guariconensis]|uniref:hypothetical protein n=1 Tax=Pseudomonas guariconensis TaxID=1288410 RepID=UPI003EE25E57
MTDQANTDISLGAIVGWSFAVFGLLATLYGWRVRGQQQRNLAKRKDIHDSIDKAVKALTEYEDGAISFWTEKDTKLSKNSILILHRRLTVSLRQIEALTDSPAPYNLLQQLHRSATLDFEVAKRPISTGSERVARIAISAGKLLNSSYLMKSWKEE